MQISIDNTFDFYFVNDDSNPIKIHPNLVFVDEKPIYNKIIEIKPYNKVLIRLPDVTNKLLENSNSLYEIFKVVE